MGFKYIFYSHLSGIPWFMIQTNLYWGVTCLKQPMFQCPLGWPLNTGLNCVGPVHLQRRSLWHWIILLPFSAPSDIIRSNFKNSPQAEESIPYMAIRQEFLFFKRCMGTPTYFCAFFFACKFNCFYFRHFPCKAELIFLQVLYLSGYKTGVVSL